MARTRVQINLTSRLEGAVWGHLVGDALGVPYEFRDPTDIADVRWGAPGTHGQPPGSWSDDGALMLALLDSLLSNGFDLSDQARRALAWRTEGAYRPGDLFDIGITTRLALDRAARGVPPQFCGGAGEDENGNGSLMRILPVALVFRAVSEATLVDYSMKASSLTHAHPRSQLICALYCLLVRDLLVGAAATDALEQAIASLRGLTAENRQATAELEVILAYPKRTGSGYVVDCFWSAWEAFARAAEYSEAVINAVKLGRDTDTTAAVAGSLAGVAWGIDGIPTRWLSAMRGRAIVEPIVARLVGLHQA